MVAVEKRKNIFVSLLINHIILAVIGLFIVMPVTGKMKIAFGVAVSAIYYTGLYDFSLKEAIYHKRPYTEMKPSYKYPLAYGLISLFYVSLPVILLLIKDNVIFRGFYLLWDSLFSYTGIFTLEVEICEFFPLSLGIIAVLNVGFSYFGYYHGMKNTSVAKIVNGFIYKDNKKNKK